MSCQRDPIVCYVSIGPSDLVLLNYKHMYYLSWLRGSVQRWLRGSVQRAAFDWWRYVISKVED